MQRDHDDRTIDVRTHTHTQAHTHTVQGDTAICATETRLRMEEFAARSRRVMCQRQRGAHTYTNTHRQGARRRRAAATERQNADERTRRGTQFDRQHEIIAALAGWMEYREVEQVGAHNLIVSDGVGVCACRVRFVP